MRTVCWDVSRQNSTICESQYGELDPNNHKPVSEWTQENGKHYHKCEYGCDTHLDETNCFGGEATCTEKAVCEICFNPYGEINASNHTNLVKAEAKAATHLETGNREYWYCDGCNKYFSDEAGTKEITLESTVIPKLTEHTADDTGWHSDETNHWNTCECGEVINKEAHSFGEWTTTKEATKTEPGSRTKSCTVCGYKVTESSLKTDELTQKYTDTSEHTYTPDWSGLPSGQTWSYSSEYSVSNGSIAKLTKQDIAAANGKLTYAISGGKAGDKITLTL